MSTRRVRYQRACSEIYLLSTPLLRCGYSTLTVFSSVDRLLPRVRLGRAGSCDSPREEAKLVACCTRSSLVHFKLPYRRNKVRNRKEECTSMKHIDDEEHNVCVIGPMFLRHDT